MFQKILPNISAKFFHILFLFTWLALFFFNLFFSKFEIHTLLNSYHFQSTDFFFFFNTHLGDGIFAILIIFLFSFVDKKFALLILASFLLSSLITQFLKNVVFDDVYRPYFYIKEGTLKAPIVSGVKMHQNNSFPSGHTTTIFALTSLFSFYFNKKITGIILFLTALLTGYSRIYLSQHFLQDVLAGALIGVSTSFFLYSILKKRLIFPSNKN